MDQGRERPGPGQSGPNPIGTLRGGSDSGQVCSVDAVLWRKRHNTEVQYEALPPTRESGHGNGMDTTPWHERWRTGIRLGETAVAIGLWASGLAAATDMVVAVILLAAGLVVGTLAIAADPGRSRRNKELLCGLVALFFVASGGVVYWRHNADATRQVVTQGVPVVPATPQPVRELPPHRIPATQPLVRAVATAAKAPEQPPPDVGMVLVYPDEPCVQLVNSSDTIAKQIRVSYALWTTDGDPHRQPLPIDSFTADFVRPHQPGGPVNFLQPIIGLAHRGERYLGLFP